jgi:cobalt-zinc-cadmium resistance protein CzcA
MQDAVEKKINELPEVDYVFSKIGTADIASDPMPPSVADIFAIVKPRDQWPNPRLTKSDFVKKLEKKLAQVPGNKYEITQPIQMRFNELIAGTRSDVAVKIFGDDIDSLISSAGEVEHVLASIPGAADVRMEQVTGLSVLTLKLKLDSMARLGIDISDVQDAIEIAIGGKSAGKVFKGDRRFDLIVRLPEDVRKDIELLKKLPIPLPKDHSHTNLSTTIISNQVDHFSYIPLGEVVTFEVLKGPNQISRENSKRRVVVTVNVRERDLGSFVREAQKLVVAKIFLQPGYWISWGGQFEHLISAANRLWIIIPVALLLIFFLLYSAFGSTKNSLLIFTGIPLALTGGFLLLWIRGIPLSISAAVGFIALSGVAVLNGIVMVSFIDKLRNEGVPLDDAIRQGSLIRLRPVLMTALVASLGFIPMALANGTGAEVQRPLATVVIGGIISSTILTLLVLPALYRTFHTSK